MLIIRIISTFCFLLIFSTCSLDKCRNTICDDNQVCIEGKCLCLNGFSGENCEIEDVCISQNEDYCIRGECGFGGCKCPEFWNGKRCDSLLLRKFDGMYRITVIGQNSELFKVEDMRLRVWEDHEGSLNGPAKAQGVEMGSGYHNQTRLTFAWEGPVRMGCSYWAGNFDRRYIRAETLLKSNGMHWEFEGYASKTEYTTLRGGGIAYTTKYPDLTIIVQRIGD